MSFVTNSSIFILINDKHSPYFEFSRGIRQGRETLSYPTSLSFVCRDFLETSMKQLSKSLRALSRSPLMGLNFLTYSFFMTSPSLPKLIPTTAEPFFRFLMTLQIVLAKNSMMLNLKSFTLTTIAQSELMNAPTS